VVFSARRDGIRSVCASSLQRGRCSPPGSVKRRRQCLFGRPHLTQARLLKAGRSPTSAGVDVSNKAMILS
jgi:hypothetical protein